MRTKQKQKHKKCTVIENSIKYLQVSSCIANSINKYIQVSQNVCNKYRQPRQKFSDHLTVPLVSRDALRHAGPCHLTLRAGLHEEHVEVPVRVDMTRCVLCVRVHDQDGKKGPGPGRGYICQGKWQKGGRGRGGGEERGMHGVRVCARTCMEKAVYWHLWSSLIRQSLRSGSKPPRSSLPIR